MNVIYVVDRYRWDGSQWLKHRRNIQRLPRCQACQHEALDHLPNFSSGCEDCVCLAGGRSFCECGGYHPNCCFETCSDCAVPENAQGKDLLRRWSWGYAVRDIIVLAAGPDTRIVV